ncbi:MAG: pyridoxamine 5'-phosphate oxidase family protein [Acidobacteria bacterium]|nr:pyridoxamine 5'-phosphate oxidase family protein [Acidobacteriota bacterium]
MPPKVCDELLAASEVGRIAFINAGAPLILPVNFRYHRGRIVFRTALGSKLNAAGRGYEVAFEIDDWDAPRRTGWSVLVRGTAEEVVSESELEELFGLGLRPWADQIERSMWVQIHPRDISGRRIPSRKPLASDDESAR